MLGLMLKMQIREKCGLAGHKSAFSCLPKLHGVRVPGVPFVVPFDVAKNMNECCQVPAVHAVLILVAIFLNVKYHIYIIFPKVLYCCHDCASTPQRNISLLLRPENIVDMSIPAKRACDACHRRKV